MAIFAPIFQEIDHTIVNTITGNVSSLMSVISPLFLSGFTIYLLFLFLSYWQGSGVETTIVDLLKRVFAWAVVIGFSINIGAYNDTIMPIVLHLGDGLSQTFSGTNNPPENALDELVEMLTQKVNENTESLSILSGFDAIAARIASVIINMLLIVCGGLFLVVAGAYILITKIFLAILAVVGPLFIASALFPATRQYFSAWLNQVLNYSLLILFIKITATVFTTYLGNAITGSDLQTDQGVIHILLTSGLFTIVLLKLPDLASGLMGGIASGGFAVAGGVARGAGIGLSGMASGARGVGTGGTRVARGFKERFRSNKIEKK